MVPIANSKAKIFIMRLPPNSPRCNFKITFEITEDTNVTDIAWNSDNDWSN
jgi:hypothetical protein